MADSCQNVARGVGKTVYDPAIHHRRSIRHPDYFPQVALDEWVVMPDHALHLASSVVIGQLAPDGMLACLLADLRRDIPVCYLETQNARKETKA